ncbi:Non-catalytic module family EXPN, partial [Testicularia cyperi]
SHGSSGGNGKYRGKGTWYKPHTRGACGSMDHSSEYIVALSSDIYSGGKHCFRGVRVCEAGSGNCVNAKVSDLCPGCKHQSLDMSPPVFRALAPMDQGVIDIVWSF